MPADNTTAAPADNAPDEDPSGDPGFNPVNGHLRNSQIVAITCTILGGLVLLYIAYEVARIYYSRRAKKCEPVTMDRMYHPPSRQRHRHLHHGDYIDLKEVAFPRADPGREPSPMRRIYNHGNTI